VSALCHITEIVKNHNIMGLNALGSKVADDHEQPYRVIMQPMALIRKSQENSPMASPTNGGDILS